MQPNYTVIDAQYIRRKHEVLGLILDVIFAKIDSDEIDEDDARDIAEYILARLESVQLIADLYVLLSDLAQQWPMFEELKNKELAAHEQQAKNQEKVAEDQSRIESLKKQLVDLSHSS